MKAKQDVFDEHEVLHSLKHFLPAQAPLKDFIHHNTLHAFQTSKFFDALNQASEIFGYKVSMTLHEYRSRFQKGEIRKEVLERVIRERKGTGAPAEWMPRMLTKDYTTRQDPAIGKLRGYWKKAYRIDMDSLVQPVLFRLLCNYLDQGISMWSFPIAKAGFFESVKELERNTFTSLFRRRRARQLLKETECSISELLRILVGGNAGLYETYLFDQQFSHQGWSGMVSTIEDQPETLLNRKPVSLKDLIRIELLLEIDAMDSEFGEKWQPLETRLQESPDPLFRDYPFSEQREVLIMWQEAFEWSYYDQVLSAIREKPATEEKKQKKTFQAMFCIDDRECSFRRYLEHISPSCETFGTPGFFSVEFYFKPEGGKFVTKLCPAPVTPKYLIKEVGAQSKVKNDPHLDKPSQSLARGWLISQTLGFWSAFKLFLNIFRPSSSPATADSFQHMDKIAKLTIENKSKDHIEGGLQVGFTITEMTDRVESLLRSIGLVDHFAPLVYVIGHGSSSTNNPHYAAYDCGACSGRPGSVNARVFCHMANHPQVRKELALRGIQIPPKTEFIGGLHDTSRDEIMFFDEDALLPENRQRHEHHEKSFRKALEYNAKERSRRLELIDTKLPLEEIHERIRLRSVSLFEPRPELNHATNALCIVGRRSLTQSLFLDRRSFLNSFDYRVDPEGKYLLGILRAAAPVCGGINLEYFFSRVDNQKLGAGSKLPHNVMGLFGVANGYDGDLRPGLPSQMIEVHDPVRLLIIVEHFPDVILKTIQSSPPTYEWFLNEWVHLVAVDPETGKQYYFRDEAFHPAPVPDYQVQVVHDPLPLIEQHEDNLPVLILN